MWITNLYHIGNYNPFFCIITASNLIWDGIKKNKKYKLEMALNKYKNIRVEKLSVNLAASFKKRGYATF